LKLRQVIPGIALLGALALLAAGPAADAKRKPKPPPLSECRVEITLNGTVDIKATFDCDVSVLPDCYTGDGESRGKFNWRVVYGDVALSINPRSRQLGSSAAKASQQTALLSANSVADYSQEGTVIPELCHSEFKLVPHPAHALLTYKGSGLHPPIELTFNAPADYDPEHAVRKGNCGTVFFGSFTPVAVKVVVDVNPKLLGPKPLTIKFKRKATDPPKADCTAEMKANTSETASCSQKADWSGTVKLTFLRYHIG
jgi:hypothetical protein